MGILRGLIILLGCIGLYSARTQRKKPHIILMIADDLGWNDVSFHGSKQIPTINIDALARDGIILNQYYVQPSCSPSRGSLMTGKYPIRIGFQHDVIKADAPWGLPLKEKILPQYLKSLKYKTHAVGKWHLGFFNEDYLPMKRGFDSFFGYYTGVEDYLTHFANAGEATGLDLHDNYKNAWEYNGTYGTELFTDKAKKIIKEHNPAEPLFLYFAQQAPHSGNFNNPLQADRRFVKLLAGIEDLKRKTFAAMVSEMDESVGQIFRALYDAEMLDDTIFIFTTDNGGAPEETDGARGSNWPLKGSKYNLWEGGVRGVSFIWSPFLRHRSRIYNGLMHISDWLPTILSAAGGFAGLNMLPEDIDGVDQWVSLAHDLPSPRPEILLNIDEDAKIEGIRRWNFKLVKGSSYNGQFDKWYDQEGRIFNTTYSIQTPQEQKIYKRTYRKFVIRSYGVPHVLREKYDKDPRLAMSCTTMKCKQMLEVQCGAPPPVAPTCDAQKEPCLYDIIRDPCEFYNIAEQLPNVTAELERAIKKYKTFLVPPGDKPGDPKSNPKLHGGAWVPWT